MWLLFLKSNWKTILIAVAMSSLLAYGKYQAWQKERAVDALNAYKIQVELVAKEQAAKTSKKIADQEKITTQTAIAYSDAIERLRKYYEKDNRHFPAAYTNGLRLDENGSSGMSAIPDAAKESNAGAESDTVSAEGVTALDCASDVLTLLSLQKWVKEQKDTNSNHE